MTKQLKMKDKMRQRSLCVDERNLFEKLCDQSNLEAGFKAVKKNGGAPGIDGVTIKELKFHRFLKVLGEGSHIFPNLGYLAEKAGT